jgi:hypothetical protein
LVGIGQNWIILNGRTTNWSLDQDSTCIVNIFIHLSNRASYGDRGRAIINNIIYDSYDPYNYTSELIQPLTALEFIDYVIIPEVANILIKGDLGIEEGYNFIRGSAADYGTHMEPGSMDDPILNMLNDRRARQVREKRKKIQLESVNLYDPPSSGDALLEDMPRPRKSKLPDEDWDYKLMVFTPYKSKRSEVLQEVLSISVNSVCSPHEKIFLIMNGSSWFYIK